MNISTGTISKYDVGDLFYMSDFSLKLYKLTYSDLAM